MVGNARPGNPFADKPTSEKWLERVNLSNRGEALEYLHKHCHEPEKLQRWLGCYEEKMQRVLLLEDRARHAPLSEIIELVGTGDGDARVIRRIVTQRVLYESENIGTKDSRLALLAEQAEMTVKDLTDEALGKCDLVPVNAADWLSSTAPAPDQIFVDAFDAGDKVAVIGPSKMRKSFFLLQMSLCLAAGWDFLGWKTVKPRRVLHCQFEIQEDHFHRRVQRVAKGLGMTRNDWQDRLQVLNLRGHGIVGVEGIFEIAKTAVAMRAEVIALDPLYKLIAGSGNDEKVMKEIYAAMDALVEQTGAAVPYVLHDAKGNAGDRNLTDRGSGSGITSRDYDYSILLTEHEIRDGNLAVVDTVLRNYRASERFVIRFHEDRDADALWFTTDETVPANTRTSKSKKPPTPMDNFLRTAKAILGTEEMETGLFRIKLREKANRGESWAKEFVRWATEQDDPPLVIRQDKGLGRTNKNYISVRTPGA